jgi:DNA-binding MarR family transcriptional regulator
MSHHSSPPTNGEGGPQQSAADSALETVLLRLAGAAEKAAEALAQEIAATPPTRRQLANLACRIYDARRTRDKYFDRSLFAEPAWDMLLALYCLPARGEFLTVSGLSHAAGAQETTGLRWQKELTSAGLIERGPHGIDRRKQMVRLTTEGRAVLERYLIRILTHCRASPDFPDRAGR